MPNKEFKDTYFTIFIENTLTDFDHDTLNRLYQPLIGDNAKKLYLAFYQVLGVGKKQSDNIIHQTFFNDLNICEKEFISLKEILEAVGLISTFVKDDHYFYLVKTVLTPYEFFASNTLPILLYQKVGKDNYEELNMDFLVRSHDLTDAVDITKHFDEVFELTEEKYVLTSGVNLINNGISIKNANFDLERFKMRIMSDELIDKNKLNDDFYDLVLRYGFLYGLDATDMYFVVRRSVNVDGGIDQIKMEKEVKESYKQKNLNKEFQPIERNIDEKDKQALLLEKRTPDMIMNSLYHTHLTSTEIAMFDSILKETGISVGYLNACILYVDKNKKGEIPSRNYYLKIINNWLRCGINTTTQALKADEILEERKKNNSNYKKKVVKTPKWYNEESVQEDQNQNSENLITIEELFKVKGE